MKNMARKSHQTSKVVEHPRLVSGSWNPPPQRELMSRALMTPQGPVIDYYSQSFPQATSRPTFYCRRRLMPHELSINSANAFFDEYFYYPLTFSGSMNQGQTNNMFTQVEPIHCAFRPVDTNMTHHELASSPSSAVPFNATGPRAPELSTPSVLENPVDVSQYEDVSYEDWLMAPADYGPSTPSSFDSNINTPIKLDPTGMDSFLDYYSRTYPGTGVYGSSFDNSSVLDMKPTLTQSTIPDTSGLPSLMKTTDLPAVRNHYGGLVNHYYQPRQTMSVSPQDVEPVPPITTPPETSSSNGASTQDTPAPSHESNESASESEEEPEAMTKSREDAILVKMRNEGYSYKDIKKRANLSAAESTLRGRYRTLTKDASERVRKPQWKSYDIRLLNQAVARFQRKSYRGPYNTRPHGRGGLPWEKIGNWMLEQGSSYHFAPATCAKKWEETKRSG